MTRKRRHGKEWTTKEKDYMIKQILIGVSKGFSISAIHSKLAEKLGRTVESVSNHWYDKLHHKYKNKIARIKAGVEKVEFTSQKNVKIEVDPKFKTNMLDMFTYYDELERKIKDMKEKEQQLKKEIQEVREERNLLKEEADEFLRIVEEARRIIIREEVGEIEEKPVFRMDPNGNLTRIQ